MGVMGCRGTSAQQNKVSRGKNEQTGHIPPPMAGEISPNIMFFEIRRRGVEIHVNTYMMSLDDYSRMRRGYGGTGK